MSAVYFGHLMTAATNDYLTTLYVQKLNCALATGKPMSSFFGSIMFEKLRAIILFRTDFNWIQKVVYSKHMNRMMKTHKLTRTSVLSLGSMETMDRC